MSFFRGSKLGLPEVQGGTKSSQIAVSGTNSGGQIFTPLPLPPPPTPTHTHTYHKIGVIEGHVECQSKGNHQEEGEEEEATEGVEDVDEHDNVDSGEGELSGEDDEINPAQEDCNGSQLPLPLTGGRDEGGRGERN